MSMPAFWQACLMIAWVFWRGWLIEVWKTHLSFLPSFSRMPSAPFFQPALSRTALALSMLNSYFVVFERNFSGLLMKFAVAWPVRP
jgi:hypothetical protein